MAYFYLVLLYLGFGSGLLLLGISSIPRLAVLRKPLSAGAVTLVALVWALSPPDGRWVLSVWAPSSVTGGWLVLDMHPELWWSVLAILATFSGILWVTVGERASDLALTGSLLLIYLTIMWLTVASGSLLLTLAMWACIDIIWFLGRLTDTADGERVVWAAATGGVASVLLWSVSLFLMVQGSSGLWWLMRPSEPVLILLAVAALMRLGFYPFQVVHSETCGHSRALTVACAISPLMGIGLLYRILSLPASPALPAWVLAWGSISVFWSGLKALSYRGRRALLPAANGLLLAITTGAIAATDPAGLVIGAGVWAAGVGLLAMSRGYEPREFVWSWPTVIALLTLAGTPPSPLFRLYYSVFQYAPWYVQVLYGLGLTFVVASMVRGSALKAEGRVGPPHARRRLPMAAGLLVIILTLVVMGRVSQVPSIAAVPFALWLTACTAGFAMALWGDRVHVVWSEVRPLLELLDLQWLYRSVWQGASNLLGVVRATATVVEGSGSVLWSVVILLLVLMVIGYR